MNDATTAPTDQVAKRLADHAAEIRALGKRVVGDVIEIGRRLTECKRIAGHGNWLPWLEQEFGWSRQTADRFMNVYEMMQSKVSNLDTLDIPVSGLYLLAAPSTPEAARDEVSELAKSGPVSHQQVMRAVNRHKPMKGKVKPPSGTEAPNNSAQPDLPFNPTPEPTQAAVKPEGEEPPLSDTVVSVAEVLTSTPKPEAALLEIPAPALPPPDPAREYLAYILGGTGAFRHVPLDADFDRMAAIIDPGERERSKKDMDMVAKIARRLLIALERSDLDRSPPTLPPAAAA
jgi:hypothetical protein